MQSIQIEFCHPEKRDETLILTWKMLEHEAAFVWLKLFVQCLNSDKSFFFRFTGFIGGKKDENFLMKELKKSVEIINRDGRHVIKENFNGFTQAFSNAIHHHFEVLSGTQEKPTSYLQDSSDEVRDAVRDLNYYIHDLEAYSRNKNNGNIGFAGIVTEVRHCQRFNIPDSFDKYFTMQIEFGDLVLHYSQIGKTWLEAFFDKDEDIFTEAIRPHYALSGEFDIMFGTLRPDDEFVKNLNLFLKEKEQDPNDSSLRLGHLPVAKFVRQDGVSDINYKEMLAIFCDIKSLKVFNEDHCIAQKVL